MPKLGVPVGPRPPWSEDRVLLLRELLPKMSSTREAADLLGVSRNVIIGLCTRRGIPLPGPRSAWPEERVQMLLDLLPSVPSVRKASEITGISRSSITQFCYRRGIPLPGCKPTPPSESGGPWTGCRMVLGEVVRGGASRYCGARTIEGGAWCAEHRPIVYVVEKPTLASKFFAGALRAASYGTKRA